MIIAALLHLKERNGSSRQALKKYISGNYKVGDNSDVHLNAAIKRGVETGDFTQPKGKSGPIKLAKKEPKTKAVKDKKEVKEKKETKEKKAKKPVAKKAAAPKKPAAKKDAKVRGKDSLLHIDAYPTQEILLDMIVSQLDQLSFRPRFNSQLPRRRPP